MNKIKVKRKTGIYHYLVFILLAIAVGICSGWNLDFSKKDNFVLNISTVRKVFPECSAFNEIRTNVYEVYSGKDTLGLGILVTENKGYGGMVPLFIGMKNKVIEKVLLLQNDETPEFIEYIKEDSLLESWTGIKIESIAETKVDAVSGATESSNAIIRGVEKGISLYLNQKQEPLKRNLTSILKDILFLLVMLLSLLFSYVKAIKKYRWIYLVLVFLIIGLFTGKVLSIKLLYGWFTKGISWQTNWKSTILLILAVFMPVLRKPKFYCNYLCPMGAFQELINKVSPLKKRNLHLKRSPVSLSEIYLACILISIVLGFSIELSYLEPFMVFLFKVADTLFFVFALLIALLSFFFIKPWCSLCPTGCLINKVHNK